MYIMGKDMTPKHPVPVWLIKSQGLNIISMPARVL